MHPSWLLIGLLALTGCARTPTSPATPTTWRSADTPQAAEQQVIRGLTRQGGLLAPVASQPGIVQAYFNGTKVVTVSVRPTETGGSQLEAQCTPAMGWVNALAPRCDVEPYVRAIQEAR